MKCARLIFMQQRFAGDLSCAAPLLLSAVLALSACGQDTSTAASNALPTPVPDLSGLWARAYIEFELPASGSGPVINRARLPTGQSNPDQPAGDYTSPILKPAAAETVRKLGEISQSGKVFPDPLSVCRPHPVPYILGNLKIEIVQQKDQVTILYQYNHQVRRVRMNARHPEPVTPSWYGDSIGHYEGDTLVVDTVGLKVGPLSMVDVFGTPFSQALHVVERYRLIDGPAATKVLAENAKQHLLFPVEATGIVFDPDETKSGLQIEFTVEDDGVFTMPWSGQVTYRRAASDWIEFVCAENLREFYSNSLIPTDDTPDF